MYDTVNVGAEFVFFSEKRKVIMRKLYLIDWLDLLSNDSFSTKQPKKNEPEWSKTVEEFEDDTHTTRKETWVSSDGTSRYVRTYTEPKRKVDVKELESRMKIAVEKEEFEEAARLRDEIKRLKK